MTAAPVPANGAPRDQLARARELAQRVRRTQRATWFPLLVFAVLSFGAIPVTRIGSPQATACRTVRRGPVDALVCVGHNSATFVYWPIALVVAYVVIAVFYARRSRALGVGSPVRAYVIAGVAVALVVTAAAVWAAHNPPIGVHDFLGWHVQIQDLYRLVGPACAIGIGLLVLAAVERSAALLVVTVAYLVIALVPVDFGWSIAGPSRWVFLPQQFIDGAVLLVAALVLAVAQRPAERTAG